MPVRSHWCDECNVNRLTNQALRRHVAAKHLAIRPFQCQNCPLAFSYQSTLQKHNTQSCSALIQKQKAIGTSIECDRCNYETTIKNHMLLHEMYSCGKRAEFSLLRCDQCHYATIKGTDAKERLTAHVFSNNSKHRSTWICDQCHQIYPDKGQLSTHIQWKHTPTELRKPYRGPKLCVCDRCDIVIGHHGITKHLFKGGCTTGDALTSQRMVCDNCEYRSTFRVTGRRRPITAHVLKQHFPSLCPRYVCDCCDREVLEPARFLLYHLRCGRARSSRVTTDIITTEVKMQVEDDDEATETG